MIRLPRTARDATGRRPRFTEGLIAGALIGAAIAGSTLWARIREARGPRESPPVAPNDLEIADPKP